MSILANDIPFHISGLNIGCIFPFCLDEFCNWTYK